MQRATQSSVLGPQVGGATSTDYALASPPSRLAESTCPVGYRQIDDPRVSLGRPDPRYGAWPWQFDKILFELDVSMAERAPDVPPKALYSC